MKGERRHELKEDELAVLVEEWGQWLKRNQKPVGVGIILVLVVGAFVGWLVLSSHAADEEAWLRLAEVDRFSMQVRMMAFRPGTDPKQIDTIRKELVEKYRGIASDLPGTRPGVLATYRAGNLLYDDGQYDEAIAQYRAAIKRSSEGMVGRLASSGIGYALEQKGQCAEAAEQFARAAGSGSGAFAAQARVDQGRCLEKAGNVTGAMAAYRQAESLAPETEWADVAQKHVERLERRPAAPPTEGAGGAGGGG